MSCSSFWDGGDLAFKTLPTLQDLLMCCDDARFVNVVMEEHVRRAFADAPASPKRHRAAERKLESALAVMRELPVRKKANRSKILLPSESFVLHAHSGLIERVVSIRLVSFACAPAVRRALEMVESGAGFQGQAAGDVLDALPQPIAYALAPWEETLGTRVWLGGPWCCRERYLVLAGAFWEMTYYGFEYDRTRASQERAKALLVATPHVLADAGSCERSRGGASVVSSATRRAVSFGLAEPERFDRAYQESLIRCAGSLNQLAQLDFWRRFEALARQLGKG